MKPYQELSDKHPEMIECFFAFSKEQIEKGIKEKGLEGKKLCRYSDINGLFGTREGITQFLKFYDDRHNEIAAECDPQEVYDHEYWNHECGYVCDDSEAINIVIGYFGKEKAKTVNRKHACTDI